MRPKALSPGLGIIRGSCACLFDSGFPWRSIRNELYKYLGFAFLSTANSQAQGLFQTTNHPASASPSPPTDHVLQQTSSWLSAALHAPKSFHTRYLRLSDVSGKMSERQGIGYYLPGLPQKCKGEFSWNGNPSSEGRREEVRGRRLEAPPAHPMIPEGQRPRASIHRYFDKTSFLTMRCAPASTFRR